MASFAWGIASHLAVGNRGALPGDTEMFYAPVAVNLLQGQGYVLEGEFTDRYPPAFPIFLATIFRMGGTPDTGNRLYPWVILALQSVTIGCVFLAAREWLTVRQSLLAAGLLAINPIFMGFHVTRYAWNATALFLAWFFLSFWLLLRGARAAKPGLLVAAGLARGIAVLVWPAPSWLWLVDVAFIHRTTRVGSLSRSLAYLGGIVITVVPWLWMVHAHTGRISMSSGLFPSMTHGVLAPVAEPNSLAAAFTERAALAQQADTFTSPASIVGFYGRELTTHPWSALSFLGHKAARAWFASISRANDTARLASQVPLWILGLIGAPLVWRRDRAMAWLLFGTIGYFWIVSTAVLPTVRYMMPAVGMATLIAALATDHVIERAARRRAEAGNTPPRSPQ